MNTNKEQAELQLKSALWCLEEIGRVLKQYNECRTEHAKQPILLQLQQLRLKMIREDEWMTELFGTTKEIQDEIKKLKDE
jgi:hypothetical protein